MWAVVQMKEGKRVKRKDSDIWYLNHNIIYCEQNKEVRLIHQDYIATDWKLYEGEKEWNLVDELESGTYKGNSRKERQSDHCDSRFTTMQHLWLRTGLTVRAPAGLIRLYNSFRHGSRN